MSKEATGENGAVLGSGEYWNRVNRAAFFGTLMQRPSETNYHETLREMGNRAGAAVEEIYDDLQEHINVIRNISSDRRSALAKQVQSLYDVCRMSRSFCSHSSDCIEILNLSSFYLPGSSFRDDRAIQTAIQKIKSCSDFFTSECLDLLQKAVDWSISFAAGSDARKTAFPQDISQGKDKEFLRDVLNTYRSNNESADLRGRCGYSIGSREYLNYVERKVLLQDLPAIYSDDYDGGIKDSLEDIARQLQRDLSQNERENNYITDDTARNLRAAVSELEHCGISTGISDSMIERLAWFVSGDAAKIRQLQQRFNELNLGGRLLEDGGYGEKTEKAVADFMQQLLHGSVPTLTWVDPLQSSLTGITSAKISGLGISALWDFSKRSANQNKGIIVFRADAPHGRFNYPHINTVEGRSIKSGKYNPSEFQRANLNAWNHTQISDDAYRVLKDFDGAAKKVRVAGKILLVTGAALDVLELYQTVEGDLHDADRKIGKKTYSVVAGIGGSWGLGALGAKGGAAAGAAIGTAIMPGVGTAIGGAVGGLVLGIAGSYGGNALGRWVVDITAME